VRRGERFETNAVAFECSRGERDHGTFLMAFDSAENNA
jgi:hypothetical protein